MENSRIETANDKSSTGSLFDERIGHFISVTSLSIESRLAMHGATPKVMHASNQKAISVTQKSYPSIAHISARHLCACGYQFIGCGGALFTAPHFS